MFHLPLFFSAFQTNLNVMSKLFEAVYGHHFEYRFFSAGLFLKPTSIMMFIDRRLGSQSIVCPCIQYHCQSGDSILDVSDLNPKCHLKDYYSMSNPEKT